MKYGLIGKKLGHSYSKIIHELMADYTYELKEIQPHDLDSFMKTREFLGINVTIPYKTDVIPYLDYIDPVAQSIGAVNTIIKRDGKLYGYNTDIIGITHLIKSITPSLHGKKVLIAGSGGTSKTASTAVSSLGCTEYYIVGRSSKDGVINYATALEKHIDADIIINTTPLGMYPDFDTSPFDLSLFKNLSGVVDVVYNPLRTTLILQAQALNIPVASGLYMLVAQAEAAVRLFSPSTTVKASIDEVFLKLHREKQNIVLTGMPGSGKSTIGKLLAKVLSMNFVDTDAAIVQEFGGSIPEIFQKYGEGFFRDLESRVIKDLCGSITGTIIATGGGTILRPENIQNLKYNGRIFFIDRPIDKILPTKDRPLSSDEKSLLKRYNERISIYNSTADVIIPNNDTAEKAAELIIKEAYK